MSPMNNLGKRFAFIIDASGRQADLAFSYWRTGTRLARLDAQSKKDARIMVEKGRDILRALKIYESGNLRSDGVCRGIFRRQSFSSASCAAADSPAPPAQRLQCVVVNAKPPFCSLAPLVVVGVTSSEAGLTARSK